MILSMTSLLQTHLGFERLVPADHLVGLNGPVTGARSVLSPHPGGGGWWTLVSKYQSLETKTVKGWVQQNITLYEG